MWICSKCQKITAEYPSNSYCTTCGNEDDFEEIEEENKTGKVEIEVDKIIDFINHNVHCNYNGDCTADKNDCKNCADYVVDYDEIYKWLEHLKS